MKLMTFILSIYLTALAIVPCSDSMEYATGSCDTEISDHNHNHSHDHGTQLQVTADDMLIIQREFLDSIGYIQQRIHSLLN